MREDGSGGICGPIVENQDRRLAERTQRQIDNLPINGRRVDTFVLLTPAVVPDGTFGLLSFRGIPAAITS